MDKYYQLVDKDPATISPLWKAGHISCLIVIIISGFIAAYSLGKTQAYFGHNCILYASISFQNTTQAVEISALRQLPNNSVRPFNMFNTQWGSVHLCDFCQFTPLCSTIFGFVWCTLFVICSRGGAGYTTDEIYRPWRLLYPAMIYTFVMTVVKLASLVQLSAGVKHFCAQFEPIFDTKSCVPGIDIYTLSFSSSQKPLVSALEAALNFTYICFLAELIHLCIILLRILCIVDFQMIRITVTDYKPNKIVYLPESETPANFYINDHEPKDGTTTGSAFAFPLKTGDDYVPIAESESLSDELSPSPRTNKPKNTVVAFSVSPEDSPTESEKYDVLLDLPKGDSKKMLWKK